MTAARPESPDERAAAATDLLVAIEAAVLALAIPAGRAGDPPTRRARIAAGFRSFLGATAVAAGTGAALHGLFADRQHPVRRALWRVSLASIGAAALAGWKAAAAIGLPPGPARWVARTATGAHVAYGAWVLSRDVSFRAAIAAYLPSAAFLAAALATRLDEPSERGAARVGLLALAITGLAAAIQVKGIAAHPRFDANATYHSVQALGILAFFVAGRRFVGAEGDQPLR